jgi:endonuclease YncB( thermonuclease family)
VQCRTVATDRFGRKVAVCQAGGRDLAEEMVRAGYATIIERRGSTNPYGGAQAEARDKKRGLWAGRFDMPSEWRRANPRDDDHRSEQLPTPRDWLANALAQLWQAFLDFIRRLVGR